jgi:hypothetical protein
MGRRLRLSVVEMLAISTVLQIVLRSIFAIWAGNGGCVEEVWNNFKSIILQGNERFIPHRILRKNADPDYYNKEVEKLDEKGQTSA